MADGDGGTDPRWQILVLLGAGFAGSTWVFQDDLARLTGLSAGGVGLAFLPAFVVFILVVGKLMLIVTETDPDKRRIFGKADDPPPPPAPAPPSGRAFPDGIVVAVMVPLYFAGWWLWGFDAVRGWAVSGRVKTLVFLFGLPVLVTAVDWLGPRWWRRWFPPPDPVEGETPPAETVAPAPEPLCALDCPMALLRNGPRLLVWNVTDRAVVASISGDLYEEAEAFAFTPGEIQPIGLVCPPAAALCVRYDGPDGPAFTFDLGGAGGQSFHQPTMGIAVTRLPLSGTDMANSLLPWRGRFDSFTLAGLTEHGLLGRRVRILYDHGYNQRRFSAGQTGRIGGGDLSLYDAAVEVPVTLDGDDTGAVGLRWETLAFADDGGEQLGVKLTKRVVAV